MDGNIFNINYIMEGKQMKLNLNNIYDIEFEDITPGFADVYISNASYEYEKGKYRDLTDTELDWLGMHESEWVYEQLLDYLY